jgi:hypothetical protein
MHPTNFPPLVNTGLCSEYLMEEDEEEEGKKKKTEKDLAL